jgi:hypothetical protein
MNTNFGDSVSAALTDVTAAADIASTLESDVAAHKSALAMALEATASLTRASSPVIASPPAAGQAHAAGILSAITTLLTRFSALF